ncbi:MAG: hypothetical protein KAR19_16550 [Bacteroidales bacterium]|nr:hypothetical protein [Bacteroidales bacterium]
MKKLSLLLILIVLLSCRKNQPPTCIITHPSNNAVFAHGISIPISVDANDPDGTVSGVKLYFNNIGIANLENFPFNFELNTDGYTSGNYTIKATVTDNSGLEASDEVQITIDADLPSVTTSDISGITVSSANYGGNVVSDGGAAVTARGVCWSTSQNPTLSDSHTSDGNGTGSYSGSITGLTCNTTYYVRAYATNSAGTTYGNQISFPTSQCPVNIPVVTTTSVSSITKTSAQSGGNITDDGGAAVTAKGVCWSTSQNPTTSDNCTNNGSGSGSFTSAITGLSCGTTYYVRAYAANSVGTSYGSQVSFNTDDCTTVKDYDDNIYQIVTIGDQIWMQENLKVTHYSDGTEIQLVESVSEWDALIQTDKAYCWYDNNSSNGNTYGALYTWGAAMNGASSSTANPSDVQGVCPKGWHLPSDDEWKQLEMYLGMSQEEADKYSAYRGTDEGGKLKETGTTHWSSPNTGATNESGFTALPAGRRTNTGIFVNLTTHTEFWTTSQNNSNDAWYHSLNYNYEQVYRGDHYKNTGLSVRCVKD